jgi:N4-(beta-N-acetylglucosaminyl)-L-asparaginase
MTEKLNRRDFVKASAAAATAGLAAGLGSAAAGAAPDATPAAPAVHGARVRPVVVSSANGHKYTNGGMRTCVETAFAAMTAGTDVLEALIAGVNIVELDPLDDSVGYGGLPNADGVVQLDSCCMHGPLKRAGGVACLEGVRTPSKVAHLIMQNTDHHLLVGRDAQSFARQMGIAIEADLNTEHSRARWLEWKRRVDPEHFLDPARRAQASLEAGLSMVRDGLVDAEHLYGTINCNGLNAKGELCGVTTTSGLAWKIPGRVGDSPILGAGLYVDAQAGAAGSTGRGEANLFNLSSYLIVDRMRAGRSPLDAGMEALRRIRDNTVEPRLLNARGTPNFNVTFYIVNTRGEYAGVSLYANRFAVCTEQGAEVRDTTPLFS